jgi:AraC-like DNA-binding protein
MSRCYTLAVVEERRDKALSADQVQVLRQHLLGNLERPASIAELATHLHLSPFHFARAFKQATGESPGRYMLRLRLHRAEALLRSTQSSITAIALAVGYESPQAFSRAFQREAGCSPAAIGKEKSLQAERGTLTRIRVPLPCPLRHLSRAPRLSARARKAANPFLAVRGSIPAPLSRTVNVSVCSS